MHGVNLFFDCYGACFKSNLKKERFRKPFQISFIRDQKQLCSFIGLEVMLRQSYLKLSNHVKLSALISIFLQLSFLNGWSYKFLVGLNWKISSCSFHTLSSFCFFEQKWLSYEGFSATTCLLYDFKVFLSPFCSHF